MEKGKYYIYPCLIGKPGYYSIAEPGGFPIFHKGSYYWTKEEARNLVKELNNTKPNQVKEPKMKNKHVAIVSLEEAKENLANWFADTITNDRHNLLDHIKGGKMFELCPDFTRLTPKDVAELYGEFNLGEKVAQNQGVTQVVVEIYPENYVVVWDIENKSPGELTDYNRSQALLRRKMC